MTTINVVRRQAAPQQRNSSIELLRLVAIFGVITLHYCLEKASMSVTPNTVNSYFINFLIVLFSCSVDVFILISGFFLCDSYKRKMSKVLGLIIEALIINTTKYLIELSLNGQPFIFKDFFFWSVSINYFIILYSVLYILSPYLNLLLSKLKTKQLDAFVATTFIIFSLLTTLVDILAYFNIVSPAISPIGVFGSGQGCTIVNFCLLYLLGAYIRIRDIKISSAVSLGLFFLSVIIAYLPFGICNMNLLSNYNSPLVIFASIFIFLVFNNFKFNSAFINEISKGSFTTFLTHSFFFRFCFIETVVNLNFFILLAHQIATVYA